MVRYCRLLEEGSFRGRTADLVFLLVFGAVIMTVCHVLSTSGLPGPAVCATIIPTPFCICLSWGCLSLLPGVMIFLRLLFLSGNGALHQHSLPWLVPYFHDGVHLEPAEPTRSSGVLFPPVSSSVLTLGVAWYVHLKVYAWGFYGPLFVSSCLFSSS